MLFFDSIATGHMGLTTVHSDSSLNTIDRLITLVKRDIKAQQYKESFIGKMLANSLDYIIFMKGYKINEVAEVKYDRINSNIDLKIIYKLRKKEDKYFKDIYYYERGE